MSDSNSKDAAERAVAGMLDGQGFAVIDGELTFLDVAGAGGVTLTGVLHHLKTARNLRVVIIDRGRELDAPRVRAAAELDTPRPRRARKPAAGQAGGGLPLEDSTS